MKIYYKVRIPFYWYEEAGRVRPHNVTEKAVSLETAMQIKKDFDEMHELHNWVTSKTENYYSDEQEEKIKEFEDKYGLHGCGTILGKAQIFEISEKEVAI